MLRRRSRETTTDSAVSDQQQHDFRIAYKLLDSVNKISWGATILNIIAYAPNPLNTSQFVMESADLGLTKAINTAAKKDKKGLHLEASKRREKIYYMHAGVASANFPLTYATWENTSDISPTSLGLSALVGTLSLAGIFIDTKKTRNQIKHDANNERETGKKVEETDMIHRQNNVAVRYINGSNLAEATLAIAGAGAYGLYEKAPAVATLLTGAAVGVLMLKGAVGERSFRNDYLIQPVPAS
jgi:hypothetical protein